jgi:hypothetical protein
MKRSSSEAQLTYTIETITAIQVDR